MKKYECTFFKTRYISYNKEELLEVKDNKIKENIGEESIKEHNLSNEIATAEINDALKKLKKRKTAGYDRIKSEQLKQKGEEAIEMFQILINKIQNTEKYQKNWKQY